MIIEIYRTHPEARLPYRATEESAAWDLYSVDEGELWPEETKIFSTGLIMRPPEGFHIKVWARSGWGFKYGVGIPHGTGIVDRDFCGPNDVMKVVLHRTCSAGPTKKEHFQSLKISKGDRIAQMTLEKTNDISFVELGQPSSKVSRGGWGSTGLK